MEPERGRKVQGEKSLTARNQNTEPKEVRDFCDSVPSILEELQKQSEDFSAGQICFCLAQWKQITIDAVEILYVFVQFFEIQDHSPSVIFLRSHKDWRYVFLV